MSFTYLLPLEPYNTILTAGSKPLLSASIVWRVSWLRRLLRRCTAANIVFACTSRCNKLEWSLQNNTRYNNLSAVGATPGDTTIPVDKPCRGQPSTVRIKLCNEVGGFSIPNSSSTPRAVTFLRPVLLSADILTRGDPYSTLSSLSVQSSA